MRSDVVKKGVPAAPNRSLLYALGYTKEELERPLIGVVCSYNEIVPGRSEILVGEVKLVFTRTSVQTPVNPDSCGLDAGWTDLPVVRQDQPDPGAASKQAAGPGRGGCADVGRRRFHPGIFSLW